MLSLPSCSKEEEDCPNPVQMDSLIISFSATGNGLPVEYQKPFSDPLNRLMRISFLQHYVSNVYLLNGDKSTLVKDVSLLTYIENPVDPTGEKQKIRLSVPRGSYTGIRMGIGLNEVQNASDPTSFDADHPMSAEQKTYWDSWSAYRFFMIEGRLDTNMDGNLNFIYGYHTGFDVSYREKTFTKDIEIQSGVKTELNFTFEVNDVFFGLDTLNIQLEPSWHGDTSTVDRTIRISDNLIDALKLIE